MKKKTETLLQLDLEYRLTIAYRIGCECAPYFVRRREVLVPAVVAEALRRGADPVDVFAEYAQKVHARHESGLSLKVA